MSADSALIDELYAPEEAEATKTGAEHWQRATPDLRYTIEDIIVEGNKGVVSWTCVSTHTGELWGIAPTGKRLATAGILVLRIENGKIVEGGGQWDALGALIQLGAIPPIIAEGYQGPRAGPEES